MEENNPESLINFYDELTEFARHHQNKGGQKAMRVIKRRFVGAGIITDTSTLSPAENLAYKTGFNMAIELVMDALRDTFID